MTNTNAHADPGPLTDAPLTEIEQRVVGSSSDYHNILWMGYLMEAEIAGRTGDTITVTWSNAPNNPYGEPKVALATYQFVDQSAPVADFSGATDRSSSTLPPGNVAVGNGDQVVYGAVTASRRWPTVTPAKAGVHDSLGSGFRRNDEIGQYA